MADRALMCDAEACREHWEMTGQAREELRRLLGVDPDRPDAP
jgi:hypothetical protein